MMRKVSKGVKKVKNKKKGNPSFAKVEKSVAKSMGYGK